MDQLHVIEGGQNDDVHIGPSFFESLCGSNAIHARHADIHQNHIRGCACLIETFGGCKSFLAVCGDAYYLYIRLQFQQFAEPLAYKRLIVNDQDADTFWHSSILLVWLLAQMSWWRELVALECKWSPGSPLVWLVHSGLHRRGVRLVHVNRQGRSRWWIAEKE